MCRRLSARHPLFPYALSTVLCVLCVFLPILVWLTEKLSLSMGSPCVCCESTAEKRAIAHAAAPFFSNSLWLGFILHTAISLSVFAVAFLGYHEFFGKNKKHIFVFPLLMSLWGASTSLFWYYNDVELFNGTSFQALCYGLAGESFDPIIYLDCIGILLAFVISLTVSLATSQKIQHRSLKTAGLLGVCLGSIGIHDWYLDKRRQGMWHTLLLFLSFLLPIVLWAMGYIELIYSGYPGFWQSTTLILFTLILIYGSLLFLSLNYLWGLVESIILLTKHARSNRKDYWYVALPSIVLFGLVLFLIGYVGAIFSPLENYLTEILFQTSWPSLTILGIALVGIILGVILLLKSRDSK